VGERRSVVPVRRYIELPTAASAPSAVTDVENTASPTGDTELGANKDAGEVGLADEVPKAY
jgi:hypothetical protein